MARSIGTAAWMAFVDGENLTIRGQKVREAAGDGEFERGAWWEPDVFLWFPRTQLKQLRPGGTAREQTDGSRAFAEWGIALQENPTRAHYYTSANGDAERLDSISESLWALGFEPNVFKKTRRNEKAKGVDIALTTAMVSHAHLENYEAAILVAGDRDYLPLVEEVKRRGKHVTIAFFNDWIHRDLRRAADGYISLDHVLKTSWSNYRASLARATSRRGR